MKILHVISSLPKTGGGTSEIIPKICEEQVRSGLGVSIAYRDVGSLSQTAIVARDAGVKLIPFAGWVSPLNKISFSWGMFNGLGKLVADADIVHIHGGWLFAVWWAAHCAKRLHKPYVMMPHGSLEPERLKISKWRKRIVGWLFDRRVYKHAAAVWVTAGSEATGVRAYGVNCPVEIVPLGLDVDQYVNSKRDEELVRRLGVDPKKKIVLYFSRITKVKGLDMLADAWANLSERFGDWQLVVAGPDDFHGYRETVEKKFSEICKPGGFKFTGPVYGEDKYKLLKSASAFVLPTRNENFSIVVAEALASAVPVVCTKGAPWSFIEGCDEIGRSGYWVDISVEGIEGGLVKVLTASDAERAGWGRNGLKLIERKFSWSVIAQKMRSAYDGLIA